MRILAESGVFERSWDLVQTLRERAFERPRAAAFTLLEEGVEVLSLTYGELDRRARAVAATLQASGMVGGQRALLLYPFGVDFVAAFFGALYARVIAVPVYPPDPARLDRTLPRLRAIARDAQAQAILTTGFIHGMFESLSEVAPELGALLWIETDPEALRPEAAWAAPVIGAGTPAFIQYTSGSTSHPKGVLLTHGNLTHNVHVGALATRVSPGAAWVSWLPMFHDMGLIGSILQTVRGAYHCVLLSPAEFLRQPVRWLQAISRYGAATSGGPNFAYDLCVRKVTDEERDALDLRCWTYAFNGAEPVRSATLERFVERFSPCGFARSSFRPLYGLAESTLMVTGMERGAATPSVVSLDPNALGDHRIVHAVSPTARSFVGCGPARPGLEIAIVDPETQRRAPADRTGEIWVSGPSVGQGYWNLPDDTERTFGARLADAGGEGPFLRTGDLGFLHGGELFVTGRLKDLIVVRGRNVYPQDLEHTAESVDPALRPGCSAAFSTDGEAGERVVLLQEVNKSCPESRLPQLAAAVRAALAREHDVQPETILFLRHGSIPKTSSGKIQRSACKSGHADGTLAVLFEDRLAGGPGSGTPPAPGDALERIRREVGRLGGVPPAAIHAGTSMLDLGLDSMGLAELVQRLRPAGGQEAFSSDLGRQTVGALAALLGEEVPAGAANAKATARPFRVEWDLAVQDPALFQHLCRREPWVEALHRTLSAEIPVPPTNNLFDDGVHFRPGGHFRAFYARGPGESVVAIKGADLRCEDQAGFLQVLQQRPFERFARHSVTNVLEYFLIQERKIPGALTLPEALAEAGNAARLQAGFVEQFGALGGMPVPLLVARWSEEVVEAFGDRLLPLLSDLPLSIAEGELRNGLACYVYYFPRQPFPRVSHFAGALAKQSARTGGEGVPNTRLIYSTLKHNADPQRAIEAWMLLVARMLLLGYFPSNALHFKNGQSIEPQNVLLNGTVADMDSATAMGSLATDREFYVNFLAMLNLLANTVRVLLTAESNGTTAAPSPFPHQFQRPDFMEILSVIHVWERLRAHLDEQARTFRGVVDPRLSSLLSTGLSFPVLFDQVLHAIYYQGPRIPESVVHMLGVTDVYSDLETEARPSEGLEYDARLSLDSAALVAIPASFVGRLKISAAHFIRSFLKGDAAVVNAYQTFLGRIGLIVIPVEDSRVLADRAGTLDAVTRGLELAGRMGAGVVSMTGLIPSATGYGEAVEQMAARRPELPRVTTGHGTTIAGFVMMVERIAAAAGRELAGEDVALLGLGSVGTGIATLMLRQLPHPRSLRLCDLSARRGALEALAERLRRELGFQGPIRVVEVDRTPGEVYEGSLILSATSVANVLDVDRLRPGTLLVDDSAPHCLDPRQAIRRFQERRDLLFTEAGAIQSHRSIEEISDLTVATGWDHKIRAALKLLHPAPNAIMGCVFSSILTSRFPEVPRMVGVPKLEDLVATHRKLRELQFEGARLYFEDLVLDDDLVRLFRERHGRP